MTALSIIPKNDWNDFGALPPDVKSKFRQWVKAVADLDAADNKQETAQSWAVRLGVSVATVFSKRSRFRAEGWKALVEKRLVSTWWNRDSQLNLPPEAVEYLKKLFGDYKRKSRPAARAFVRQWKRWSQGDLSARIPGFAACPKMGAVGDHPDGWSERNLMRYLPSKFELAAERRGLSHAVGECGPQVFTTRAHLHYMSHLMIDDVWHDNFVVFGKQGICRVLELNALDVFSGALVFWGSKPRLKRVDGSYDSRLAQYVPLLLGGVFVNEGFSPLGTTILAEHGTAAVPERLKKFFHDVLEGAVKVRESGITGEEQAIIGWRGKGKGNSRFKAALESHHNLKHNELAALPGQTGLDRNTRPEFTVGMLEDDDLLLRAMLALSVRHPQRAAQLRTRLLDYHSAFQPALMDIYREINGRDWHALEGWDAIPGNVAIDYRLAPDVDAWLNGEEFAKLPATAQDMLLAMAAADKRYIRRRRLSPAAVQQRERGQLVKLRDWQLCELLVGDVPELWAEFSQEVKVEGAYFNLFSDAEISTEAMRYESVIVNPDGQRVQLTDDKYLIVRNPFDPSRIFVHDAGQNFLGVARVVERVNRFEDTQLRRAYGYQAKRVAELTAPLVKRHAADIRAETERLAHNANVLAGTPEAQLDRLIEKADPVKDQLARSAKKTEADNGTTPAPERWDS